MTIVLENQTDLDLLYGYGWIIEKQEDGVWQTLGNRNDWLFQMVAYILEGNEVTTVTVKTPALREEGFYRVKWIATFSWYDDSDSGNEVIITPSEPMDFEFLVLRNARAEP